MTIGAVSGVSAQEAGLASGLINTSQQIGGALGLAILVSIANSKTDDLMRAAGGDQAALPNALTEGFQVAFLVGAVFAVVGAVLAATLISSKESREHAEAAQRGDVTAGGRGRLTRSPRLPGAPRAAREGTRCRARILRSEGPGQRPRDPARRPVHPGDAHDLQGQPEPQRPGRDAAVALRVDGHVHVRGEDRDERGDQPPARCPAGARMQHARAARQLRDAAREHDLAAMTGERVGHDRLVHARPQEVQAPGGEEEGGERDLGARHRGIMLRAGARGSASGLGRGGTAGSSRTSRGLRSTKINCGGVERRDPRARCPRGGRGKRAPGALSTVVVESAPRGAFFPPGGNKAPRGPRGPAPPRPAPPRPAGAEAPPSADVLPPHPRSGAAANSAMPAAKSSSRREAEPLARARSGEATMWRTSPARHSPVTRGAAAAGASQAAASARAISSTVRGVPLAMLNAPGTGSGAVSAQHVRARDVADVDEVAPLAAVLEHARRAARAAKAERKMLATPA